MTDESKTAESAVILATTAANAALFSSYICSKVKNVIKTIK